MKKDEFDKLFDRLQGQWDLEEPEAGHQARFLEKLNASKGVKPLKPAGRRRWKPFSIAASIALFLAIGIGVYQAQPSMEDQIAEMAPEVSRTQFHFANMIEEEINKLEREDSPETRAIVDDTMKQLRRLESDYKQLEQDLLKGGNQKLILSAMITNFQTRIDLLHDVLQQIETIKTLKNYDDANTIG